MVSKKRSLVNTALGILLLSVAYISSCTRPLEENPYKCNYVVCVNGGRCDSARCKCPTGYEGTDCGIATVDKFLGYWNLTSVVIGSDTMSYIGKDSTYPIEFKKTATQTTFFLYNFDNNPNYNSIVCLLDSMNKNNFIIDTTPALNMMYDHYRIRGGYGNIYSNNDSVSAIIFVRRLNSTVNWQNDTLRLYARKS